MVHKPEKTPTRDVRLNLPVASLSSTTPAFHMFPSKPMKRSPWQLCSLMQTPNLGGGVVAVERADESAERS